MHHAAGHRSRFVDFNGVAHAGEVIRGGQSARSGADHQNALTTGLCRELECPAFLSGQIAQEAFDCMNANRLIEFAAVTGVFARMVADAAVNRPASDCPAPKSPRLPGTFPPGRTPATPGCPPRRDKRCCRGAGNPHRSDGRYGQGRMRVGGSYRPEGSCLMAVAHDRAFMVREMPAFGQLARPVSRRKQASTIASTIPAMPTQLASWNTPSVSLPPPAR